MENPNPLSDIEHWEDDLLRRYPDPETKKNKAEFRNYEDSERIRRLENFTVLIINTKPTILYPKKRRSF